MSGTVRPSELPKLELFCRLVLKKTRCLHDLSKHLLGRASAHAAVSWFYVQACRFYI